MSAFDRSRLWRRWRRFLQRRTAGPGSEQHQAPPARALAIIALVVLVLVGAALADVATIVRDGARTATQPRQQPLHAVLGAVAPADRLRGDAYRAYQRQRSYRAAIATLRGIEAAAILFTGNIGSDPALEVTAFSIVPSLTLRPPSTARAAQ